MRMPKKKTYDALAAAHEESADMREALAHSQRMEALGQLSGGIAHDINNILQTVMAAALSIKRRTQDESILRIIRLLEESTARGSGITRRLLAFARRGDLRKEAIDPGLLLQGLEEVLSHTLGNGIRVTVEAFGELPPIVADRSLLETTLINLAVNGRDAMQGKESGELTLQATLDFIDEALAKALSITSGCYVRFSVKDTGEGMSPETLRRATEPFFTTKSKERGTGLGLSMAKGFAEQSGGAFSIASTLGEGTTATLWLPCNGQAAHQQAISSPNKTEPHTQSRAPDSPVRILLVDDDPTIRGLMKDGLNRLGWIIEDAPDGETALGMLQKGEAFDILITDLSMPGMDGLSLIRAARVLSPNLPTLLVTAHAGQAHTVHLANAAASGPFAVLNKPVSPQELATSAENLIRQQRAKLQADALSLPRAGGGRDGGIPLNKTPGRNSKNHANLAGPFCPQDESG